MTYIGKGREAIALLVDPGSFEEGRVGNAVCDPADAPSAVRGTARIAGDPVTLIANDARAANPRFPAAYSGAIGLEEAYAMALAVYDTIAADRDLPPERKRPILLVVDTPGNAPGKLEEILGVNKATAAYQLALSESRKRGHPSVAVVVGRAISGGFLCHGLHAGIVICLAERHGTLVHVMPLTSIARIIKVPLEQLQTLVRDNPVFAAGPAFVHALGGLNEIVDDPADLRARVAAAIRRQRAAAADPEAQGIGPVGRMRLGMERGGRRAIGRVLDTLRAELEPALSALGFLLPDPATPAAPRPP